MFFSSAGNCKWAIRSPATAHSGICASWTPPMALPCKARPARSTSCSAPAMGRPESPRGPPRDSGRTIFSPRPQLDSSQTGTSKSAHDRRRQDMAARVPMQDQGGNSRAHARRGVLHGPSPFPHPDRGLRDRRPPARESQATSSWLNQRAAGRRGTRGWYCRANQPARALFRFLDANNGVLRVKDGKTFRTGDAARRGPASASRVSSSRLSRSPTPKPVG